MPRGSKITISLEEIIDSIPVWVFFKDKENHFISVNQAYAASVGLPKEKLEGMSAFDIYPREQAEAYWNDDKQVIASGKAKRHVIERAKTKSGQELWVETLKVPYRDSQGRIQGIIGFSIDITERKNMEDDLLLKTALLEAQLSSSIDGILAIGTDRKTLLFNQRFLEMWKVPSTIAKTKDDKKMIKHILDQLIDPKQFVDKVEYLYLHPTETDRDTIEFKDGKVFERYTSPLIDNAGKIHGRIWYFHDNTTNLQYTRELEKMNELMVGRELKMAELKKKIKELGG